MRVKLLLFLVTIFLMINTYYDNYYISKILKWKKYYTITLWGFIGLSLYLFFNKHPTKSAEMLHYATNMIRYVPIDKDSKQLIKPILDYTNTPQPEQRLFHSGKHTTKRSVSETKKKYVAANQNWKCGKCNQQLTAWFEVDHKIRLDSGGSNHINNLIALCRNCHGEKTALENL